MKKYRTKSGKVEEKLPGINATVSPSEKVQIAMAGGANTLGDVQTILGQSGKRNNLKGQGAKHFVSFDHGEDKDDSSFSPGPGGGFGSYDTEAASDVNQGAVDAAAGIAAGKPGPGMFGGYSGGGGFQDPSGGSGYRDQTRNVPEQPPHSQYTTSDLKFRMDYSEKQDFDDWWGKGLLPGWKKGQSRWSQATKVYEDRREQEKREWEQGYKPAPRESTFSKTGNKARGTNLRSASDAASGIAPPVATSPEKTPTSPLTFWTDKPLPPVKEFNLVARSVDRLKPNAISDAPTFKEADYLSLEGFENRAYRTPGWTAAAAIAPFPFNIAALIGGAIADPGPGVAGHNNPRGPYSGWQATSPVFKPTPPPDDGGTERPACPKGSTKSASGACLPITSNNTTLAVVDKKDTRASRSQLRSQATRRA